MVTIEGHQKKVVYLKFNPIAESIIATGSYDNTVKIHNL